MLRSREILSYLHLLRLGIKRVGVVLFLLAGMVLVRLHADAKVVHGIDIPDLIMDSVQQTHFNSVFQKHPLITQTGKPYVNAVELKHSYHSDTGPFYVFLGALLFLAIFKYSNREFFTALYASMGNTSSNNRQMRDHLIDNSAANLLMNVFTAVSISLYLFVVLQRNRLLPKAYPDFLILAMIILAVSVIYIVKFCCLKISGWALNISSITDNYIYNVFVVNKILGILLLPFTFVLAFGHGDWITVVEAVSFVLVVLLISSRYLRSFQSLDSFVHFSKFHFFMYFCTSELLPLAILIKCASIWLHPVI